MPELELNEWLKAEDLSDEGDTVVEFLDEGEFVDGEFEGKKTVQFVISVGIDNVGARKWTMNKTAQRAVASHYGSDTAKWVGKKARVYFLPQMVSGKERNVIFARGKKK